MKTSSRKAKGRRLQQFLTQTFLKYDPEGGYKSTTMGESGTDVYDPLSRLPFTYVEAKNWESWPNLSEVVSMMEKKTKEGWACVFSRNHCRKPTVIIDFDTFETLLSAWFKKGLS